MPGVFSLKICYVELAVSLSEISVDSVYPLYGPVSGGTQVTISGQLLTVSTVTAVYIGQYVARPHTNRLSLPFKQNNNNLYSP